MSRTKIYKDSYLPPREPRERVPGLTAAPLDIVNSRSREATVIQSIYGRKVMNISHTFTGSSLGFTLPWDVDETATDLFKYTDLNMRKIRTAGMYRIDLCLSLQVIAYIKETTLILYKKTAGVETTICLSSMSGRDIITDTHKRYPLNINILQPLDVDDEIYAVLYVSASSTAGSVQCGSLPGIFSIQKI